MKIDISPYLSKKSSDFDEILYTAADFELDERHVTKNEKVALDRLRVRQNLFLVDQYDCHRVQYTAVVHQISSKSDDFSQRYIFRMADICHLGFVMTSQ